MRVHEVIDFINVGGGGGKRELGDTNGSKKNIFVDRPKYLQCTFVMCQRTNNYSDANEPTLKCGYMTKLILEMWGAGGETKQLSDTKWLQKLYLWIEQNIYSVCLLCACGDTITVM
jgi:hypothetical protein